MFERQTESTFIDVLAFELGMAAYIFGFPLVLMDVTRTVFSRFVPINQLEHTRSFPNEGSTEFVRPNVDVLYSSGFLDLSLTPIVLSVPSMADRYYVIQIMDAWTNIVCSLGTRTTGNKEGRFILTCPGWRTRLPDGIPVIESPTNLVFICVRTETNTAEDYMNVHNIQDRFHLIPVQAFARLASKTSPSNVPNVDTDMPPCQQVAAMSPLTFLSRMTALMANNPPSPADDQLICGLTSLGIRHDQPGKLLRMKGAIAEGLEAGCRAGLESITNEATNLHGRIANGWQFSEDLGRYGTRYLWRAAIAMLGFGATLQQDITCARTAFDENGAPLNGSNRYVLRFPPGEWPPVNAFWTITIYDDQQHFVSNPIGRFAISSRDRLKLDNDGSLILYIQHRSPGRELESNWLPAPRRTFSVLLRLYWPKDAVLNGRWKPAQIAIANAQAKASA